MINFTHPTPFPTVPIDDQFIEVFTTCNEVATRIEPTTHRGKLANARRAGGKLVWMADWEPVFVDEDFPDKFFWDYYWQCPNCERDIHPSIDECPYCDVQE